MVNTKPTKLTFTINTTTHKHQITLFNTHNKINKQFNITKQIPNKKKFYKTLHYYHQIIKITNVTLKLNHTITTNQLQTFNKTILTNKIIPHTPPINKINHPKILNYLNILRNKAPINNKITIINYNKINFNTTIYLNQPNKSTNQNITKFYNK